MMNICNVCVHIYIYIHSNKSVICVVCMCKSVFSHQNKRKRLWALCVSHVNGVSEKFICVGNRCNIRVIFKTKRFEERGFTHGLYSTISQKMVSFINICLFENVIGAQIQCSAQTTGY
jgi:hypothetical protein